MSTGPGATPEDLGHMRRALVLAARGRRRAAPNPMVGAVIVSADGLVVGEGFHESCGGDHAEVVALAEAGPAARGGTLHVTLEPCCHHGRTPPCTRAVLEAGVRRVVYGMEDPATTVSGRGVAVLREAGLEVIASPLAEECRRLNRAYLLRVECRRPLVVAKWAMTLDGRIGTASGTTGWLSGEEARAHAHHLRDRVDAILVGCGTVKADDPRLTCRGVEGGRDPLRVILDGRGCVSPAARVATTARQVPTLIATATAAPGWRGEMEAAGVEVWQSPPGERMGEVALEPLLEELARRGVTYLLVEGGPATLGGFRDAGLVDRVVVYVVPALLGGGSGWGGPVAGVGAGRLDEALRLGELEVVPLGADVCLSAEVLAPPARGSAPAGEDPPAGPISGC